MKQVGRALYFRAGINELVRSEIDRYQQRERDARAKLEKQLQQLEESNAAANKEVRQLNRRYMDLVEKYNTATELLARRHEQFGELKDHVQSLEKAQLSGRLTALELARQDDHADQSKVLTAQLETLFPVSTLSAHVQQVLDRSPLAQDPYPHVVLDDVLPDALHTLLYESRPPEGFWREGQSGRQNWTIGEDLAPLRTEAVWRFMDDVVASRVMTPTLAVFFDEYLRSQTARRKAGKAGDSGSSGISYERSGGRLMLRRPGYTFEPHLDPRRALLTALFYFGRPQDSHDHGTKLYRSNATVPEKHSGVYYPLREGATCELVKTIPSRPNSMLVFASRIGLHGADIPPDAQPPTLERYAYQFYIGKA